MVKDDKKHGAAKCMTNKCTNGAHSRGLCQKCLSAIRAAINAGQVTDAELVSSGVMLAAQKRGPKSSNPIAAKLASLSKRRR